MSYGTTYSGQFGRFGAVVHTGRMGRPRGHLGRFGEWINIETSDESMLAFEERTSAYEKQQRREKALGFASQALEFASGLFGKQAQAAPSLPSAAPPRRKGLPSWAVALIVVGGIVVLSGGGYAAVKAWR